MWGAPSGSPMVRRGTGWAVAGIVIASVGMAAALLGAMVGIMALLGNGLIYAASEGKAGSTHAFVELTRIGDLAVVMPLAIVAAACTGLAWRAVHGGDRSRVTTVVATVMTSVLALVALLTMVVFI